MNEYTFADISIGQKESFTREITPDMENAFRAITGDNNPLHRDDAFAREIGEGKFDRHAVFGMLTASLYSTLAGMYLPGKYSLIHSFQDLSFVRPVFSGDTLTVSGEVTEKQEAFRLLLLKIQIRNQDNKVVSKGKMKVLVMK